MILQGWGKTVRHAPVWGGAGNTDQALRGQSYTFDGKYCTPAAVCSRTGTAGMATSLSVDNRLPLTPHTQGKASFVK
jgi:hypothetical protein